jgi:hypothetical protein
VEEITQSEITEVTEPIIDHTENSGEKETLFVSPVIVQPVFESNFLTSQITVIEEVS